MAAGVPSADWPEAYDAVIFSSARTPVGQDAYEAMANRMKALAETQPGFLGMESARGTDGVGITVSYWQDEASIQRWKQHGEHLEAQAKGKEAWYASYTVRVARVERGMAVCLIERSRAQAGGVWDRKGWTNHWRKAVQRRPTSFPASSAQGMR